MNKRACGVVAWVLTACLASAGAAPKSSAVISEEDLAYLRQVDAMAKSPQFKKAIAAGVPITANLLEEMFLQNNQADRATGRFCFHPVAGKAYILDTQTGELWVIRTDPSNGKETLEPVVYKP